MGEPLAKTEFDALVARAVDEHERLPPQLQRISQFVLDNPQRVALMTIAEVADEIDVQPSGVIRFSKALGYSGFSEIQRILKEQLGDLFPRSYFARLESSAEEATEIGRVADLARASLSNLPSEEEIARGAQVLLSARLIHVIGLRRAFGVASYLTYLLGGFEAPVRQLTALGDMADTEALALTGEDALIAVSFPSYRPETRALVASARRVGASLISITDSHLSPIARGADVTLITDQETDAGFRSVVGSMVTAQALALEYGRRRRA
ncbi:MAG: MurR/RpiR family transcriptional regulator [Pseudomonadota bacterium]